MAGDTLLTSTGALADIIKASQRLNPCVDLDVDILAVNAAAVASTTDDWGTLPASATVDATTNAVRIAEGAATSLFSQTAGSSVKHHFTDGQASSKGPEEYCIEVFPSPSVFQGVPFTLASLDVALNYAEGAGYFGGVFLITLYAYDDHWHKVPLGDPIALPIAQVNNGGVTTIDFRNTWQRRFVFAPGTLTTKTGPGRTSTGGIRTVNVDSTGASQLIVARGLSIGITPQGKGFQYASIGCCPTGTLAAFDPTQFWRSAPNRNTGPYDPTMLGANAQDVNSDVDGYLSTGAVPGYGTVSSANGDWGIARKVLTQGRGQDGNEGWHRPYFNLKAVAYQNSTTFSNVLDVGTIPTGPVDLRIDDIVPAGTSRTYALAGSNTSAAGPWTAIGAVSDGQTLDAPNLYRWYQLTPTLTAGPTGATKYATPALQAWSVVARTTLATLRYLDTFDATDTIDPTSAQSGIGELVLPITKPGRRDYRDLATRIATEFAPASIEAHVYARNTVSQRRYFITSYRLENREPSEGVESLTFVTGMDRLTVTIPAPTETYRYPVQPGTQATVLGVSTPGAGVQTITVTGTPFNPSALANMRYHGVSGQSAGQDFAIQGAPYPNTTSAFTIVIPTTVGTGQVPAIGDTFEIHSDQTTRVGASYSGEDFAAIYADLLQVQGAVPSRYCGVLPAPCGRTATHTLSADGVKAQDVLEAVALNVGGAPAWRRGRIDFVDLYGPKDATVTWTPRHMVSATPAMGADRRMPSIRVKYDYQPGSGKFANEATINDFDTLTGLGRANLFDTFDVKDEVCQWCDATQATWLANTLQGACKYGVMLWKVKTAFMYPYLNMGDAVSVVLDEFTARQLHYTPDGLTDNGAPIKGWVSALGVIVGKNLWGTEWLLFVRGLNAISATTPQAGGIALPAPPPPNLSGYFDGIGRFYLDVILPIDGQSYQVAIAKDAAPDDSVVVGTSAITLTDATTTFPSPDFAPGETCYGKILLWTGANGTGSRLGGYTFAYKRDAVPDAAPTYQEGDTLSGEGGVPGPTSRYTTLAQYDRTGTTPLIDPDLGQLVQMLAADGKGVPDSTYSVNRKSASAAGNAASGMTGEGLAQSGLGGVFGPNTLYNTLPQYNANGDLLLIDPTTGALVAMLAADGNGVPDSTYSVNRKAASASGNAASGMTSEGLMRAGIGGVPTPNGLVPGIPVYDQSGAFSLIDTATGRMTGYLAGPTGISSTTIERGGNKADAALNGSNQLTTGVTTGATIGSTAAGTVETGANKADAALDGSHKLTTGVTTGATIGSTSAGTVERGANKGDTGFTGTGALSGGVVQSDGAGGRPMVRGRQRGTCRHGDVIAFSPVFQNVPVGRIWGGALNEPRSKWGSTGSGSETGAVANTPQYEDFAALGLSASGFTCRARLRQKGTPTPRTDTWGSGNTITTYGATTSSRTTANAPSVNDNYLVSFTGSIVLVTDHFDIGHYTASVTIAIDLDITGTGGWNEVGTRTYTAQGDVTNVSYPDYTEPISDAVPIAAASLTSSSRFQLRIKDWSDTTALSSFSITANDVTYTTEGTGSQFASKTPDTDDVVYYEFEEAALT